LRLVIETFGGELGLERLCRTLTLLLLDRRLGDGDGALHALVPPQG
jgi:hypothetical protein